MSDLRPAARVPLLVLGLYASLGTPSALSPQASAAPGEPTPQDVEAMVAKLADTLEKNQSGKDEN